ncbi:transport protein [Amycolatopsis mediterranei S699]|uniref:Transport protein n=2 Tax=Amycolatopsis mediterranei TaxID=33910 RepID=A0A0H3D6N0_AMYMU|nr:DMT family transporter [Amycolatopsis mediterranei]ADJ46670.1 transport protein [Amycolatopsis mediterranei U32]AFO78381.1 transport protein [Amycolatopsis mediterranei S699]AGT85509.1 transport protein [Amycolatopsis mediterranei RB]KDO11428.1 membrane protein [Amycolatopsis mediterranei]KDU90508.1 membrane protein [Amycolatopsis mediterranei]
MRRVEFGVTVRFALLAVVWGASFLFIKVGLGGLSPGQVALARVALGALALAAVLVVRRRPLPRDPVLWGHLAVVSVLLCVVPFLLFSWAEQYIPSGLASIFNATTPLVTMLLAAAALPEERFTPPRVLGLLLGFAGVLTIVGVWHGIDVSHQLTAQLACLGATTCYGACFVYMRRFLSPRGTDPVVVAFGQTASATVILGLLTPVIAVTPVHLSLPVVGSMVALGVFGTGLAYVWNTRIIAAWGAANASAVTYLTPVVGVLLGVLVLGEPVSWNQPAGALLVIAGILAAHGKLRLRRATPAEAELADVK